MVVMGAGSYAAPQVVTFMKSLGLSWNYTYWVFAVLAVILLVAMQMQTFPGKSAQTEGISAAGDSQESNSVIALLKQPKIYFYALGIFLYVGVEVGIANTIAFYLEDRFAISSMLGEQAELVKNTTISNYWLGLLLGRLISSSFLDKISGRLAIKIYISLATVALYFATHTENLTVALWAFPVIAFFLSIMFPTIYSMTNNRFPKKYSDAISSVLCTAIIGGACIGPAIAWLAESTSVTNTPNWNTGLYIAYACFAYLFIVSLAPNDKG
jgi:fucose permease